ncbi:MAG TPA: carboxypeptidase regulatory-like domain-containing protein [Pyrinomonadaceae bacterium]|nr:carboxypeptidase regulatory-like domain-containing protein [Pyrinomonadaceae bacterium]
MSHFSRRKKLIQCLGSLATIGLAVCAMVGQQVTASLRGDVSDEHGGRIVNAKLTAMSAGGVHRTTATNDGGAFSFDGLMPGKYIVHVSAPGFETYESTAIMVAGQRTEVLQITLKVAPLKQDVSVPLERPLNTDPDNNIGAVILRNSELDALPDDPDLLIAALKALAGTAGGPDGGEIFVDGFTAARTPPKGSIREVRINQNPFSAEFDRAGFGRIEIFTKAGATKFAGSAFLNFNDESLNSRDPFALNRPPFNYRLYGGNATGPLAGKNSSFFVDFDRRGIDDNAVINAIFLDQALKVTSLQQVVPVPRRRTSFSPRFDWQANPNHTLVGRYTNTSNEIDDLGVGSFSLLSRAYDSTSREQTFQLTETSVLTGKLINEIRFQYSHNTLQLNGNSSGPSIVVLDSFLGGSSSVGLAKSTRARYELGDYVTFVLGKHALRVGARLRRIGITDLSASNFNGTFTYAGGLAPQLDSNNQIVSDTNGQPLIGTITSIERYRRTLFFQQQGRTNAEIRPLGGGATQFSIAGGNPEIRVSQTDLGTFIQDDWRLRPNLTIGLGLRYEVQSNIKSYSNLAPRIAFGWSPTTNSQGGSRTVIRGGFGIFYSRVSEDLILQASRFNGLNQRQSIVNDPAALDLLSSAPTASEVSNFAQAHTTRRLSGDIRSPYSMQSTLSVERQLPFQLRLSVAYVNTHALHVLRTRNVNAPLLNTLGTDSRPQGNTGNVYQYESSGVLNQHQLVTSLSGRVGRDISLNAIYTFSRTKGDTDGVNTFPAYSYDLSREYGRSLFDIRHRFFLTASAGLPWNIRLSPMVVASSSRPFNILTGRDTNGDSIFSERPAFATDLVQPNVVVTPLGAFNLDPAPGQQTIPRNFGNGPGFFAVSLRASKTIRFGSLEGNNSAPAQRTAPSRSTEKRYSLSISLQVWNLFNRTNLNAPVGNLSSPFFGRANSIAGSLGVGDPLSGKRLIELQTRFSF